MKEITGGVDTHAHTHTVAALDGLGRLLGHATFPATMRGYAQLRTWLASQGRLVRPASATKASSIPQQPVDELGLA